MSDFLQVDINHAEAQKQLKMIEKKKKKVSTKDKTVCFRIIDYLNQDQTRNFHMSEISHYLFKKGIEISDQQIRKYIQIIRENMTKFISTDYFLIASIRGYRLSNDYKEIESYLNATEARMRSAQRQLLEMARVIYNIKEVK